MTKHSIVLLLAVTALAYPASAEIIEQIIVKVNGEILTKTELEHRQVAALRARNQSASHLDLRHDDELRQALAEVTPQLIVDAIDEMLITQIGKERGYRLGDDQFQGILERIRKENNLEEPERFEAALKQEGLTMADLRKSLERQMVVSRVQNDMVGRVSVSDEEARRYYKAHASEFTSVAAVTLREILVEVPAAKPASGSSQPLFSVAADDEGRAKAEALRARAVAGEDFAAMAATESSAASKANGGLVGPLNRDEIAESLHELIDPLKPGDISAITRTARGYQFFKLESYTPSTVKPFDEAREDIMNRVFTQKRADEFRRQLRKLRGQAIIEWKNDEIRKLYDQQVAAQGADVRAGS
jgi:parvulin-like peptidyl-prolyl isomerase